MAKSPQNRNQTAKKEAEVASRSLNVLETAAPAKAPTELRQPELTPAEKAIAAMAPKAPEAALAETLSKGIAPTNAGEAAIQVPAGEYPNTGFTPAVVQPTITPPQGGNQDGSVLTKRDNMSPRAAAIAARIDQYVEKMSRGSGIEAKEGIKQQVRLYYVIMDIVKSDAVDFKALMDYLLDTIYANRDNAFSLLYVRRWTTSITELSEREIYNFDYMLNLIVTVGSSSNRARALRQVSLADALRYMPDEKATQLISGYFAAYTF